MLFTPAYYILRKVHIPEVGVQRYRPSYFLNQYRTDFLKIALLCPNETLIKMLEHFANF